MSDIETLRELSDSLGTEERKEALAALERVERDIYLLRRTKEATDSKPDFEKFWEEASNERDALRAKLEKAKEALSVPQVWGEAERDGMTKAFADADEKRGHYETLFAVAAWLLRNRAIRAELSADDAPAQPVELDPRDPDPTREGMFRDHNCWTCNSGAKPCVIGNPNHCEYPHARND